MWLYPAAVATKGLPLPAQTCPLALAPGCLLSCTDLAHHSVRQAVHSRSAHGLCGFVRQLPQILKAAAASSYLPAVPCQLALQPRAGLPLDATSIFLTQVMQFSGKMHMRSPKYSTTFCRPFAAPGNLSHACVAKQ
jgi:hypothetical protein